MQIEKAVPLNFYTPQTAMPARQAMPVPPDRAAALVGPAATVDISPEAWAAYTRDKVQKDSGVTQGGVNALAPQECQTCKNRKYVDQSDDPSVSFQTPTNISPGQSAAVVMSHELEHVANEQARAEKEGRKIVSQTVSLSMAVCPECGRSYVSGGTTRTVTKSDNASNPDAEALAVLLAPNA